ncbi:MAG TPA: hypothetical protein PK142_02250 [bacterium]|nr:hypothetical protein [bacterium]
MKKSKLILRAIAYSLGLFVYIILLATFMNRASDWFGQNDQGVVAPIIFLLIFVFSALITGGLVLVKPVMLYVDGQKKDGIKLLIYTGLSIFVLILLTLLVLFILNK